MHSPTPPGLWSCKSARLGIAIALALSLAIEGLMRSNINMAMVCMVNKTALAVMAAEDGVVDISSSSSSNSNNSNAPNNNRLLQVPAECAHLQQLGYKNNNGGGDDNNNSSSIYEEKATGDLVISKQQQSLIFTSFYLGGLLIILPGSYLCDWLGPTKLVFHGALLNVIGTFVTPIVARQLGPVALAVLRFLMGCGQGILVPCVNVLVAHWFPLAEKSTAIAISTTGNQISVIVAMFLTAELCVLPWLGGWASAFYIYGIIGVFFCAAWLLLVTDFPAQSKRIGRAELQLIQGPYGSGGAHGRRVDPKGVPWRQILASMVVWSTGLSAFSQNFMNVGIVVYLPTYYQNVLGMDLTSNGLMSALPFVIQLFTKILFAAIADWIKRRELMSSTAVTKLFNLIGSLGAGACFILLSFCDCTTPYLAIGLAVSAVGLSSGFIPGYNTSVVCIAPRYTSSIASFSRLLSQIASVASPYMIGLIVVRGTKSEWSLAFWVMAAILISTGFLFQFFGSASVQHWAIEADHHHHGEEEEGIQMAISDIRREKQALTSSGGDGDQQKREEEEKDEYVKVGDGLGARSPTSSPEKRRREAKDVN